jgi:hypothetical protein
VGTRRRWAIAGLLVLIGVVALVWGLMPGDDRKAASPASPSPPSGVAAGAACGPFAGSTDTAADGTPLVCWFDPDGQLRWRKR